MGEHLWGIVRMEETEMRRIHGGIHGEWCLGSAPDHPSLADPFHWTITEYKEGAETSESANDYPQIDLEDDVIEFRRFSVDYFGQYIVQKPKVEEAWRNYNIKLLECADLATCRTWSLIRHTPQMMFARNTRSTCALARWTLTHSSVKLATSASSLPVAATVNPTAMMDLMRLDVLQLGASLQSLKVKCARILLSLMCSSAVQMTHAHTFTAGAME